MYSSTLPSLAQCIAILSLKQKFTLDFQSKDTGSFTSAEATSTGEGHADSELEPGLAACSATGVILHCLHQTFHVLLA